MYKGFECSTPTGLVAMFGACRHASRQSGHGVPNVGSDPRCMSVVHHVPAMLGPPLTGGPALVAVLCARAARDAFDVALLWAAAAPANTTDTGRMC